ncbi:MAG TPA: PaaX family transcriptional regulator C-terminal domain-containing protein [Pseudolabrys sp.]|nr:PaaX family transcriptional regulator C-terminal domain-containing protein [Pseudolabrys sp.]
MAYLRGRGYRGAVIDKETPFVARRVNQAGSASGAVAALVDHFHRKPPVRAWSLIVTLYGDAMVPRGGCLWLGSLSEIMALFRIDAGHVRTAMSRLTADGWLERVREGRNSYYRLSRRGQGSFMAASRRIYFAHEPDFDGKLRVALLGAEAGDRARLRKTLEKAGFAALGPAAFVNWTEPAAMPKRAGLFLLHADAGKDAAALAGAAWKLAPTGQAYRGFIERFTPLAAVLDAGGALSDAEALVARTLLIHDFRRIVLRDPGLPAALLPPGWPGRDARALTARIYRQIVGGAEAYLDVHVRRQSGALPPPGPDFAGRFAT